ncbi:sugar phosphate isomerase/epimerase family protein [Geminisphaera colitermitum]|uniref:sugar phosphate isomerase/epimerase family protein n=1 Tax=Geminisphaera colitermitum TaxID=1148786 RepID=UPI0002D70604|nr:TIM barrel protein [Geminisphaera colitermitum]
MKPTLALSTCWNSFRHSDGYSMVKEMVDLGFSHIELSHGIRLLLVPGILRAVEQGLVKVASTHNFCPLPTSVSQAAPNLFEPSSQDKRELDQWLRYTMRSIDFASQVGASVMVAHLGSVRFWWLQPSRRLKAFLRSSPTTDVETSKRYQALLKKSCEKLRLRMGPYWKQVIKSLNEVRAYALEKGIRIGCENREKFEELPVDDDFGSLFAILEQPSPCGYWHDTGHADIKQSLGLINHKKHLEKNASQLLGFHLHDVDVSGRDHQPIGTGRIDFEMISQFWQPHHRLTLELSPRVTPDDIRTSRERTLILLKQRFGK